jgi:hypothetical protein
MLLRQKTEHPFGVLPHFGVEAGVGLPPSTLQSISFRRVNPFQDT